MRSFTSDSYRALKEREPKRCQQRKAVSKKWNKTQCGDIPDEFASSGTALEMPRGSEWNNSICISKPTSSREPSAVREDAQVQPDDPLRRLRPLSNSSSTVVGIPSEAVAWSLPDDVSNTMPRSRLEAAGSEVVLSKELDCEILEEVNVGRSATPADELDTIIPDDADASVEQPGKGCLNEFDFVCQAPCPKPLSSNNSEPCERQTLGDHTAPANPVGLKPNPEHVLAAAMNPRRNEPILAGALPVTQYRVGPGRKGQNFKSTSQTSWTTDLDEHLLHLRHFTQLG